MGKQIHSGFAQFPDGVKRDEFVRAVLERDPNLTSRAYLSGSQPTIVFENLTASEYDRVISGLKTLGRWVEDVQFKSMG